MCFSSLLKYYGEIYFRKRATKFYVTAIDQRESIGTANQYRGTLPGDRNDL